MKETEILIIDDEVQIRKLLEITLRTNGFKTRDAVTAKEGLMMAANQSPDLIILDLGLPDENGHEVLQKLRYWYTKPIIILSVQTNEADIVKALNNGANDYLTKPFRTGELIARIKSALRIIPAEEINPVMNYNNLQVNFSMRSVKKNGEPVKLTATEYSLLCLLVKNTGKALTHQYLLKEIWGQSYIDQTQYLRVYVAQLRKKIEADPNRPSLIITESGVGYRFVTD